MSREERLQKLAEMKSLMDNPKEKSVHSESKQENHPPESKGEKETVQLESKVEQTPDSPEKKPDSKVKRKAPSKNKPSKKKTIQRLMEPHYLSKVPKLQEQSNSSDSESENESESEDSEEERLRAMSKKQMKKQLKELKRMFQEQTSHTKRNSDEFRKYKRPKETASYLYPSTTTPPPNIAFRNAAPTSGHPLSRPSETVAGFGNNSSNRYRFI